MLELLAATAIFSRMVSAMAPISPLRPASFSVAHLVSLAQLNALIHHRVTTPVTRGASC